MASAISGVSSTPSSSRRSRTISPVDDASATTRLSAPKRVLSWWWSTLTTSGALWSTSGSGPSRLSFAQSSASRTRVAASSGTLRCRSSSGIHEYSRGSGASPARYMTASLPSCSSARVIASSDPSASPSGFSCVVTRKRSCDRIASATALRSFAAVVWGELIDELRHADAFRDRRIVFKGELRSPLHPQFGREPRLEHAVRGLQPFERLLALALVAEDADEDLCLPQVGRRLDAGYGHEPDARVLEVADGVRERLANRLVHASHPLSHRCSPGFCPRTRARTPGR